MFHARLLAAVLLLASSIISQCQLQWVSGGALRGADSEVLSTTMWDPDGSGPLPPVLVVAGRFRKIGSVIGNGIATYNPATGAWSSLGSGVSRPLNESIQSVTTGPNGRLIAGGSFQSIDGVPANNIAAWNGIRWSPLGTGVAGSVSALVSDASIGALFVGGSFTVAGVAGSNNIARWNGSWSPLATGTNGGVQDLQLMPGGSLVAGGSFTSAGGIPASRLANWNGTNWTALTPSPGSGTVFALTLYSNSLVAGGDFPKLLLPALGGGLSGSSPWPSARILTLATLPGGDLVVGGWFDTAGTTRAMNIARWNGTTWSALGNGVDAPVHSMTVLPNGDLIAAGNFRLAGGSNVARIARWNGSQWSSLSPGFDESIGAIEILANGDVVVGGGFTTAGTVQASSIATWNGSQWSALGPGLSGSAGSYPPFVNTIIELPTGGILVGGRFSASGATPLSNIAHWNGTFWVGLGAGISGTSGSDVRALLATNTGAILAGGSFTTAGGGAASSLALWSGGSWAPWPAGAGTAGTNGSVAALIELLNGHIVVGGTFSQVGSTPAQNIAIWNGTTWAALGAGVSGPVRSLALRRDGTLVVGGSFAMAGTLSANNVAAWSGGAWSALGTGVDSEVSDLVVLPNDDIVAAGTTLSTGAPIKHLGRWNGTTWAPLAGGVDDHVAALAFSQDGELWVAGDYYCAGNIVSPYLARLRTPCPPRVATVNPGCVGAGGLNVLEANGLPWVGGTLGSIARGLVPNSMVLAVFGTQTWTVALSAFLPSNPYPCFLWTDPLILVPLSVAGTTAELPAFTIPNSAALAGVAVRHQVLAGQRNGNAVIALTGTNALLLTGGHF